MSYKLQMNPFDVPGFRSGYKNVPIAFLSRVQRELREARKVAKRLAKAERGSGVHAAYIPYVRGTTTLIRLDKVASVQYRFRGPRFGALQTLRKNGNRFSVYFR